MVYAQGEGWQPITPQDLQIKEVPGDLGASAVQLYYADFIDDNLHSEFLYSRIKVLNDKGKKYADVEIPILPDSSIADLKARTIHPDGKIIEFSGKPFQKTIIKGQGVKYLAKTFTLPEVTVGSIIEYKFLVLMPEGVIYDNSWTIQHDLYTVKESFRMKAYSGELETKHGGSSGLSMVSSHMPANLKPQKKGDGFEMQAQNIAAFEAEDYMPPEENYKPQVRFFYGGSEISSMDKFWQETGRDSNGDVEHFIGNHKEIQAAAEEAIGKETDWDKQVQRLYVRAQQIRNLSYERERTKEELKKENLKPNGNVVDVLNHGYGTRKDIVLFFAALARAGGFRTSVLRVSNRKDRFFDKGLFSTNQLDAYMAVVKINGQDVYLDPGTKFCPYGFVRWMRTSTAGLKLDKDGGTFVTVPAVGHEKAIVQRSAIMALGENGSLNGEITVQFQGLEALERRLDALETDEAGRNKSLEDELKNWLSAGAVVNETKVTGWEGEDEPLVAHFHVEIPGYASLAGKRLLLPPYLFQTKQKDAFKRTDRKYPVYFPYAFAENDVVAIKIPAGYTIEGSPKDQDVRLPYAAYAEVNTVQPGQLVAKRQLLFNAIYLDVKQYSEVRDFFGKVQAADEQQAVLRVGGTTSAQKGN
ncbi:MAG TPA: DUF3857 domain-containing protein [Candidatus Angelobacter sp.]